MDEKAEFHEFDEAGNVLATYIHTRSLEGSRIDVITSKSTKSLAQQALDIFLPAGYPHSVSDDYTRYQIFVRNESSFWLLESVNSSFQDSVQAFSSSIADLICSRAVLEGVGVGDATASSTAAVILSVIRRSLGHVTTIAFAYRFGQAIEPECKLYRLAADVFNNAGMLLECLSPLLPRDVRVGVLALSSVLKSLCGVAAGSAKASLSAHFARWGNIGELNAKDSSQETMISLLGMLAGTLIVSNLTSQPTIWTALLLLQAIHLFTNYLAVSAVVLHSLNRQRLSILASSILDTGVVLSPHEVGRQEHIFARGALVRRAGSIRIAHLSIGQGLGHLLRLLSGSTSGSTGSFRLSSPSSLDSSSKSTSQSTSDSNFQRITQLFSAERYVLYIDPSTLQGVIVLKHDAAPPDMIRAWVHGIILARRLHDWRLGDVAVTQDKALQGLEATLGHAREFWREYAGAIADKGWDLDVAALETRSGARIR